MDVDTITHPAAAAAAPAAAAPVIIKHKQVVGSIDSAQMPWVEKYRPATLEDLVAHEDIVAILTRLIDSDNLPHLLLYGPPGTGKVRFEMWGGWGGGGVGGWDGMMMRRVRLQSYIILYYIYFFFFLVYILYQPP